MEKQKTQMAGAFILSHIKTSLRSDVLLPVDIIMEDVCSLNAPQGGEEEASGGFDQMSELVVQLTGDVRLD